MLIWNLEIKKKATQQIPPSLHVMVLRRQCDHSIAEGHLNLCILISFLPLRVLLTLPFNGDTKETSLRGERADGVSARQILTKQKCWSLKAMKCLQDSNEYNRFKNYRITFCTDKIRKTHFWWPFLPFQMENKLLFCHKLRVTVIIICTAVQNSHWFKKKKKKH